ncbi:MAG: hypothetical protein ABIO70_33940, partial [Pseudomonadota bacterium]
MEPARLFSYLSLVLVGLGCMAPACDDKLITDTTDDTSGDSTAGPIDYDDADGDLIMDIHEGLEADDRDGDGTPNYLDLESDGDTINDKIEAGDRDPYTLPIDSDGDSVPDFLDFDSDNNGIEDVDEKNATGDGPGDTDGDGIPDYRDLDNDGDGILDEIEIGGDPASPLDSDGDSTPDYMDIDSDGDGLGDIFEGGTTEWEDDPVDTDGDGTPDYLDDDSDGDGISDSEEGGVSDGVSEPRDTDGDGLYDSQDLDADGDGLSDPDELSTYGTDPYDADSDGDGQSDGAEVLAETDPLDPTSVIEGIYVEVPERTDAEEDFNFELSIQMGDVGFLIDTTGSMGSTANAMAAEFANIVTGLETVIEDMAYGFATYDDYTCCGYGSSSSGDRPFILQQAVTTDTTLVQNALNHCPNHYGGDGPESSIEALYQGITGAGYDMNCDRSFSTNDDVKPFIASASDPFGGTGGESWLPTTPDGGTRGGFGFRDYALAVLIYATDYDLRDPDAGYGTPGGCAADASSSAVVTALAALGGYVIGVHVNSYTTTPYNQMIDLAQRTGSYADMDGDGSADDELVLKWAGSSSPDFRNSIISAVQQLVDSVVFGRVELQIEGDIYGFVTDIQPPYYENIDPDAVEDGLDFTLTF